MSLYVVENRDPTVDDDFADGYRRGKRWINRTTNKEWVLGNADTGAAVWISSGDAAVVIGAHAARHEDGGDDALTGADIEGIVRAAGAAFTAAFDVNGQDIYVGAGGIGNDNPILTFAAGANGLATFAGAVTIVSPLTIGTTVIAEEVATKTVEIGTEVEIGQWPANAAFAFFGNADLDHTVTGNYALLQASAGDTYLNAANGKKIFLRNNNVDVASVGAATVQVLSTNQLQFRDAAIHIASLTDGHLDLTADISIDLNTPDVVITGAAANMDINATSGAPSFRWIENGTIQWVQAYEPTTDDWTLTESGVGDVLSIKDLAAATSAGLMTFNAHNGDRDFQLRTTGENNILRTDAANDRLGLHIFNPAVAIELGATTRMNGANVLQFGDSGTYIYQRADSYLTLVADGAIELTGNVALGGGLTIDQVTKSAGYTATAGDYVILCDTDTAGAGFTITLPAAASHTSRVYYIKNTGTGGFDVTVDGNGGETIDGETTQLVFDGECLLIVCDGTEWWVL